MEKKNRVKDRTTTTGTGTADLLASSPAGYRTFVSAVTDGATVKYLIESEDQTEWEIGIGTFTDGTPDTLSRDTVINSSNSDSLVDFSAGTKEVTLIFEAGDIDVYGADEKTTPADDDLFGILDSAASYVLKKLTWANIKATLKTYFDTLYGTLSSQTTGWIPQTDTWTFSSVDDPTGVVEVDADLTGVLSVGMRLKMTNGGNTIYGIISKTPTESEGVTTVTFLHEIDPTDSQALHLLADSAITNVYFSPHKAPFGFPLEKTKWRVRYTDAGNAYKTSPVNGTIYYADLGSHNISVPIGNWDISAMFSFAVQTGAGGPGYGRAALSTANDSISDETLAAGFYPLVSGFLNAPVLITTNATLAAKTSYYIVGKSTDADVINIAIYGGNASPTVLEAVCAYL